MWFYESKILHRKKKKQGDIEITKDLEVSIKGKTIYIVDDIFDSGNTMKAVVRIYI